MNLYNNFVRMFFFRYTHRCFSVVLFFFGIHAFLGCNNHKEATQIAHGKQYMNGYIAQLNSGGFYQQIENSLDSLRPHLANNTFLQLCYYRCRMNNIIHYNKVELGIAYADTVQQIYQASTPSIKQAFESAYMDLLCQKGSFLFSLKRYTEAYGLYYQALLWANEHQDLLMRHAILYTVGMGCYKQKQYEKAAQHFLDEIDNLHLLLQKKQLPYREFFYYKQQALNNTGLCFTKLSHADSALFYYTKALDFIDSVAQRKDYGAALIPDDFVVCKSVVLGNLAKVYVVRNELSLAIQHYRKAIDYVLYQPLTNKEVIKDSLDASMSLIQLGNLYVKQQNLPKVQAVLQELNTWLPRGNHGLHSTDEMMMGWLQLNSQYYSMKRNMAQELYYTKAYLHFKDSIDGLQKDITENNLQQDMEIKFKDQQLALLKLDNQLTKIYNWVFIGVAFVIAVAALFIFFSNRRQKRNNAQLKALNNALHNQQKETELALSQLEKSNQEKDKILRVVAHDLRNPLSGITSLAKLLQDEHDETTKQQMIQMIADTGDRSLYLVNDLLHTQDMSEWHYFFEDINLADVLQHVVQNFRYTAEQKKIEIQLTLSDAAIMVRADMHKLERVVYNLLHNALKFSHSHSKVQVMVQQQTASTNIIIKDAGVGMTATQLAQLFSAQAQRVGTQQEQSFGLGLSICKRIIEAHKGQLHFASKENEGTTVTIMLPIIQS